MKSEQVTLYFASVENGSVEVCSFDATLHGDRYTLSRPSGFSYIYRHYVTRDEACFTAREAVNRLITETHERVALMNKHTEKMLAYVAADLAALLEWR